MLKVLTSEEYVQKLLATPRVGESNVLAFYEHRLGVICKDPRLMLIPLDDHMVHRGDGVFETIKAENFRLYQLPAHLERLKNSASGMNLTPPCQYSDIHKYILKVASAGGEENCMLRVLVGRGPGGFGIDPNESVQASLYIIAYRYKPHNQSFYDKGLSAFRSKQSARDADIARIKNTNYRTSVEMIREAKERGLDVALSFDKDNCLAEGAIANACLVDANGQLIVPEFTHALPGTTILRIIELAQKEMPVIVRKVKEEEIFKAKEMMLTGTTVGCVAITSFDQTAIGDGTPGPIAKRLKALLAEDLKNNGIKFK